jgi:hypothetical protein
MESEFFSTIYSISTNIRESNMILMDRINILEERINSIYSIPKFGGNITYCNKNSDVIIHGENKNYYNFQYYSTIR